jgi:AAA domain (dynein-related subfamily)
MSVNIAEQVAQLEALLPVIKEKEVQGLIPTSYAKAVDLVQWYKRRGSLSEKQELFVGRLILRANRKHRSAQINIAAEKVDEEAIIQKVVQKIGNIAVDQKVIIEQVMKQMDARRPVETKIIVAQSATDKGKKVEGPRHKQFIHLVKVAAMRLAGGYAPGIFLQGEASSGKTTGARQLAEALGLKWHFNGAISFPHEMLGFIDGAGKYHRTPFREAYEKGGVYTFDEVDRSDPVALLAVNPHLANGVATFPDGQVKRHKDCIIICTANTWGLGADANYSGATKLDAAFLSRFPIRINWDIDPDLESAIVPNAEWLAKVRNARSKARASGLKVLIDTRAAQAGAAMIEAGYTMQEAANMTFLANLKSEQRQQIDGAI